MIDVAELKTWLGNPSEPGLTDLLTALEADAVGLLEYETERYFGAEVEHTEELVGDGSEKLRIRERPSAITSVEYRSLPGESWTAIAGGDEDGWELRLPASESAGGILVRKNGNVWTDNYEFRVIYDFGYTPGQEPGEIRLAVMRIVSFLYRDRGREGLRSESVGDYSFSILAETSGKRDILSAVPGLDRTIRRWRGVVYA